MSGDKKERKKEKKEGGGGGGGGDESRANHMHTSLPNIESTRLHKEQQ